MPVLTDFSTLPASPWNVFIKGSGVIEPTGSSFCFVNDQPIVQAYSNAQIDDYQTLPRRRFLWKPPLRLTVRARFSHPAGILSGTAGFGFWNDPFMMTGKRRPTLPRAVWFFYSSPPSNMKLDINTPGPGWKAATIDALGWPFFALAPLAPFAIPLMNVERIYRACWPLAQRAINVSEAIIKADMTAWHSYDLFWKQDSVAFRVDNEPILQTVFSPRGPLGFVMWLDNQYMVVTPQGRFKYGLLSFAGRQWLEVSQLEIGSI